MPPEYCWGVVLKTVVSPLSELQPIPAQPNWTAWLGPRLGMALGMGLG